VVAGWRKHYPGNVRDVVIAPVTQTDAALPEPSRVAPDDWVYPGCPHTGPGIAVDSAGASHVAWFTGKQGAAGVYYAREQVAGGRRQFTTPVALAQARTLPASHAGVAPRIGGGAWVAWDINDEGRRVPLVALFDSAGGLVHRVVLDTLEGADHPQVVALRDGRAVIAWSQSGPRPSLRLVRVREGS